MIQNISMEQLDALFGEVTPLNTAPVTTQIKTEDDTQIRITENTVSLPVVDSDEFLKETEEPTEKTEVKEVEEPKVETPEPEKEISTVVESTEDVKSVLKNTVDYLIEKGIWKDFDGREELDIDEATYSELAFEQNKNQVQEMFSELVDSTGAYGKAIIEHVKNGGNPDEVIDLFKEQKQIESIDTTTDEGKLEKISNYYHDVLGWKPDRIQKHVKRIIAEDDLDNELTDIEEQYNQYYENQLAEINHHREAQRAELEERKRQFVNNLESSLVELGYTDKEKKTISESILKPRKLENGIVTTDFNLRFAQIQQDPKKLIKLVEFVMDEDKFINKIKTKEETKAAEKSFKFIKGNASVSKTKTNTPRQEESSMLDFSSLLKNKK